MHQEQFEKWLPSRCITSDTERVSFLRLGELSFSFLNLDQFPTFYRVCFQYDEIYPRVLLMLSVFCLFCLCHFFWDIFSICATITSFMLIRSLSLHSSGPMSNVSPMAAMSTFPWSPFSSITSFVWFEFHLQCYHSYSFAALSFLSA